MALVSCGPLASQTSALPGTGNATPSANYKVVFGITGKGESSAASTPLAEVRKLLTSSEQVYQEPIELGAPTCFDTSFACLSSVFNGSQAQNAVVVTKVIDTSTGTVVQESTPPTVSVVNPTYASATSTTNVNVAATTTSSSLTSLNITFPDVSGTLPVYIYSQFGVEYSAKNHYDDGASQGYTFGSESKTATNAASGDIFFDNTGNLHVPNGAVWLPASMPISKVLDCTTSFVGTPFTQEAVSAIGQNTSTQAMLLAKTSSPGVCVKVRWAEVSTQGSFDSFSGLSGISNSNGQFKY